MMDLQQVKKSTKYKYWIQYWYFELLYATWCGIDYDSDWLVFVHI